MTSQDDRDFKLGNMPEGLNVAASLGAPEHLNTSSLSLKQDVEQFGLAGKIWQSAYTLQALFDVEMQPLLEPNHVIPANYYQKNTDTQPYRILELGAGTGYVGIALANLLRKPCQVYITDLAQVVPLIQENVKLHAIEREDAAEIIVDRLHWGNSEDATRLLAGGRFDLVVVSDCVYFPELFSMLLDTLLDVCDESTRVVIGYKCRSLEKEVGFWQDYFGRYFEYEPIRRLETVLYDEGTTDEREVKEIADLLGAEEQLFVFMGSKRLHNQIKAADDTFTTLLFCSMGF
ncbi:putative methyltransferase-domain-containing protein [Mucor mucedo]|uniref:putative methyltransferase-domain-containing protein n=1 Tax=Mucor mucedo TaxID=29922 RepID=UPI002220B375|nr:putative methyltransferase-domain-containing protein [Mucor mucedo]KAI7889878.1 putative methyltransferase-domain-containing protein [Mucor mucedo]